MGSGYAMEQCVDRLGTAYVNNNAFRLGGWVARRKFAVKWRVHAAKQWLDERGIIDRKLRRNYQKTLWMVSESEIKQRVARLVVHTLQLLVLLFDMLLLYVGYHILVASIES